MDNAQASPNADFSEPGASEPAFPQPSAPPFEEADIVKPSAPPAPVASFVAADVASKTAEYADNVKEAATKAKDSITNFSNTNSGIVIMVTLAGIAVSFATAYALYLLINKTVKNQSSYLLVESKVPVLGTQIGNLNGDSIPNAGNGKRSSVCFWMYIHDINKFSGSYRHIFHRGDADSDFSTAGPFVRMDKEKNSVSVTYALTDTAKTYGSADNVTALTDKESQWQYMKQAHGITFDYIPLQRWVHVCVVVNEDYNGGTITGYIDGELVKAINASTPITPIIPPTGSLKISPVFDITGVNLDKKGNVYVGGSAGDPIGPGFSGLVSKIQFFNYDMNSVDVYNNYKTGPIDNLLAKMGLPAYGIQSPIYKIGG